MRWYQWWTDPRTKSLPITFRTNSHENCSCLNSPWRDVRRMHNPFLPPSRKHNTLLSLQPRGEEEIFTDYARAVLRQNILTPEWMPRGTFSQSKLEAESPPLTVQHP